MKLFGNESDTDLVRILKTKAKIIYGEMPGEQAFEIAKFLNAAADRISELEKLRVDPVTIEMEPKPVPHNPVEPTGIGGVDIQTTEGPK